MRGGLKNNTMALHISHLSDELATAYVQVIAASAGCTVSIQKRDYGVDLTLREVLVSDFGHHESGYPVDIQIKSTIDVHYDKDELHYDLKVANYNKIMARGKRSAPYYLALIVFPVTPEDWFRLSSESLILSAQGFWWTHEGLAAINKFTKRVKVPLAQRLDEAALQSMLADAAARYL